MALRAVFFDLDGTLLDTLEDIATSANYALEAHGLAPHPVEAYKLFVGEGMRALMQKLASPDLTESLLKVLKEHYATQWRATSVPYGGIEHLLEALTCKGVKVGILSNKADIFVKECVAHFFPDVPFCGVAGEKEGILRKPDPAGLFALLEGLHVSLEEVCFVGDTKTDMETAVRAGVEALGVSWGFREKEELIAHGAKHVFEDALALETYLLGRV